MPTAPTLADFFAAWDLFREPVWAAIVAGTTLGYLGVYIVLRRMVFVSAALSQAAGLGVALAFYAQIAFGAAGLLASPSLYAIAVTLAVTALLARKGDGRWMSRESLLGVVYLVGAAGALLVGTKIEQEAHDIASILFGTAVLVTPSDLRQLEIVTGAAMLLQITLGRGFRFASFDRDGALVRGLPVRLLDGALFASIAVVVSVATRVLGALPVFAFSVLPAVAAVMIGKSVRAAAILAALLGAIAGGAGYLVAFLYAFPVGASQAVVAAALVAAAAMVRGVMPAERRKAAATAA